MKKSQLEFLGVGDLHYDKMAKIFPDTHATLVSKEFQKALNYARKNDIKYVIQYGDVGENTELSRESRRALYRIIGENPDIFFIFILGNHDWGEEGIHSLDELELIIELGFIKNCRVITKSTVKELKGIPIHFMPYPVRTVKTNHVNIAHVEVTGFVSDSGRPIQCSDVFPDDTLLLTGHLHTPQSKDPWYCSGTLYQTNFGESKDKGFHHVSVKKTDSGKLLWDVTLVPNYPDFVLENLVVETRADLKQLVKDESIRYKLFIKSDVIIPDDLQDRFPNIDKIVGYRTKKELKSVMQNMLVIETECDEDNAYKPTEYLPEFLKSRGATKRQIQRANEIVSKKLGIKL